MAKEKEETGVISAERDDIDHIANVQCWKRRLWGNCHSIDSIHYLRHATKHIQDQGRSQPTSRICKLLGRFPHVAGRTQPNALLPPEQTNYPQLRQEGGYKLDPMEEKELERRIRSRKIDLSERAVTSRTMSGHGRCRYMKTLLLNDSNINQHGCSAHNRANVGDGIQPEWDHSATIAAIKGKPVNTICTKRSRSGRAKLDTLEPE